MFNSHRSTGNSFEIVPHSGMNESILDKKLHVCPELLWLIVLQVNTTGLSRAECTSAAPQATVCLWSHLVWPEGRPPWTRSPPPWSDRTQRRPRTLEEWCRWADRTVPMSRVGVSIKHIWPVHLMKVYPTYCPLKNHYAHIWVFLHGDIFDRELHF